MSNSPGQLRRSGRVVIEDDAAARERLAGLPRKGLESILCAVESETAGFGLERARFVVADDPDDSAWHDLILELHVREEPETALSLWDDLGTAIWTVKRNLSNSDRDAFDRGFGVQVIEAGDGPGG